MQQRQGCTNAIVIIKEYISTQIGYHHNANDLGLSVSWGWSYRRVMDGLIGGFVSVCS